MKIVGEWAPGEFPPWITLAGKLTLFSIMMIRGIDYWVGDSEETARRLSEIERAAPLHWWGGALILFATIGFVGVLIKRAKLVFAAHLFGWAVYWALSVGIFIDVLDKSTEVNYFAINLVIMITVIAAIIIRQFSSNYYDWVVALVVGGAVTVGTLSFGLDGIRSASILFGVGLMHMWMATGTAARSRQISIQEMRKM